jgi:hypothetical protein
MSVFRLTFDKGLATEETIDLTCIQEADLYAASRRVAEMKMIEGVAYQDSFLNVADGKITLTGNYMTQSLLDAIKSRYEGNYAEFDFISDYTATTETWLCCWNAFTAKINNTVNPSYTFTIVLNVISKG